MRRHIAEACITDFKSIKAVAKATGLRIIYITNHDLFRKLRFAHERHECPGLSFGFQRVDHNTYDNRYIHIIFDSKDERCHSEMIFKRTDAIRKENLTKGAGREETKHHQCANLGGVDADQNHRLLHMEPNKL